MSLVMTKMKMKIERTNLLELISFRMSSDVIIAQLESIQFVMDVFEALRRFSSPCFQSILYRQIVNGIEIISIIRIPRNLSNEINFLGLGRWMEGRSGRRRGEVKSEIIFQYIKRLTANRSFSGMSFWDCLAHWAVLSLTRSLLPTLDMPQSRIQIYSIIFWICSYCCSSHFHNHLLLIASRTSPRNMEEENRNK